MIFEAPMHYLAVSKKPVSSYSYHIKVIAMSRRKPRKNKQATSFTQIVWQKNVFRGRAVSH